MDSNGLVNDAFWLAFAKDYASKAISSRDDAAAKLDTFLTTIWAIYTPLLGAGIAFDLISPHWSDRLLMALPVIIVPFARFLCIDVQLPISVKFFPNEVDSIEFECYATVLENKKIKLQRAIAATIVSILSIGVALFIYKMSTSDSIYTIHASFAAASKDAHVTAKIDPSTTYILTIISYNKTEKTPISTKTWDTFKSDSKGNIDQLVALSVTADHIHVIIEWTVKDNKKSISTP